MQKDLLELTHADRGSIRFGVRNTVPGRLFACIGSLPELYPVIDVKPKRGTIPSRSLMKKVAKMGQRIATSIYALPKEERPNTYQEFIDLLAELLSNELLYKEMGY